MAPTNYNDESWVKRTTLIDNQFLDVNELPVVPETLYDEEFIITAEFDERPDLLAYKLYGSVNLWWVFTLRNLDIIKDPIRDFKSGTIIMLPGAATVEGLKGR